MKFKDYHKLNYIGAGIIFITPKQKILLLQKKNKKWTFPGGHSELYETPLETAMRECVEETGKIVNRKQITNSLTFVRKKEKKPVHSFLAYSKEFKPKISNEHKDYQWFIVDEITPSMLSGAFAPYWKTHYLPFIKENS